eukprot:6453687-Pyramimonas_sp.AAC.1
MDAGRGAADYDPLVSSPRYVSDFHVGHYVHRDRITWLSDEEWWTLGLWHALSKFERDAHFPPNKGKASKNKEKSYSAADHTSKGKGRSRSPRGGDGQTG